MCYLFHGLKSKCLRDEIAKGKAVLMRICKYEYKYKIELEQ